MIEIRASNSTFFASKMKMILLLISSSSAFQTQVISTGIKNSFYTKPFNRNVICSTTRCFSRSVRSHSSFGLTRNDTEAIPFSVNMDKFEDQAFEQIQGLEHIFRKNKNEHYDDFFFEEETGQYLTSIHSRDFTSSENEENVASVNIHKKPLLANWWEQPFLAENDTTQDVKIARIFLLTAAALYGTNFALVKILNDFVPVGVSTSLRFGLSAIVTLPWLLPSGKEIERSDNLSFKLSDPEAFWGATMAGMEVGFWTSIGYVGQALGLESIDASKVSSFLVISR